MCRSSNAKSLYRLVSRERMVNFCEKNLHTQGNVEDSLWHNVSSTYLLKNFKYCVSCFVTFRHNRKRSIQIPAISYTQCRWYLAFCKKPVLLWFALGISPSENNAWVTINAFYLCVGSSFLPSLIWFLHGFFKSFQKSYLATSIFS